MRRPRIRPGCLWRQPIPITRRSNLPSFPCPSRRIPNHRLPPLTILLLPWHLPKHLRPGELRAIVEKLPSKKSSQPDGIANEVLKRTIDVHLPYLENLFNACLVHAYHPAVFRFAVTQVIKKADKTNVQGCTKLAENLAGVPDGARYWEKIIADRVQELASAYGLVPPPPVFRLRTFSLPSVRVSSKQCSSGMVLRVERDRRQEGKQSNSCRELDGP